MTPFSWVVSLYYESICLSILYWWMFCWEIIICTLCKRKCYLKNYVCTFSGKIYNYIYLFNYLGYSLYKSQTFNYPIQNQIQLILPTLWRRPNTNLDCLFYIIYWIREVRGSLVATFTWLFLDINVFSHVKKSVSKGAA